MADTAALSGGLVAGRYRLVRTLGAGGMGQVWFAHDVTLDRTVAVKRVLTPFEQSEEERAVRVQRAFREARHAARVSNHPNIVTVYDVVEEGGLPWIVMEYVPCRSLAEHIAEHGPLSAGEVARIGRALLDALVAVHGAYLVHRDIKPANVLLAETGQVLLTDFGIAVQESDMTMTSAGMLVGSPEYVAPERARGEGTRPASDLFSLGATLFFAAEGRSPFARETAVSVLTAVLFENAPPVRRLPQLDPLIQGLLAKDPAVRYDAPRARQELARLAAEMSGGTAGASWSGAGPIAGGAGGPGGGTPGSGNPIPGYITPVGGGTGNPIPGVGAGVAGGATPPTMAGPAVPHQTSPMFPNNSQGMSYTQPLPPQRGKTGRNVGIGVGAAVAAGAVVLAVVLSGGKGGSSGGSSSGADGGLLTTATSVVTTPTAPDTTEPSTPDDSSPTTPDSAPSSFDPAVLDSSGTDQTPMSATALLPDSFKDTKGVVYTATNRWTQNCSDDYESQALKDILSRYNCDQQAIGTYTDATGKILVDLEVMPLDDASSATSMYQDMKAADAFTFKDWGIWCPKTGAGSEICADSKNTSGAQQYGYILPFHRYVLHAVSVYINLSSDASAQDWLNPAATSGAKAAGPLNYSGNQ